MRVTLDFLRHGEPVGGRRYRGQTDDPLSQRGWAQMRAATEPARDWRAIVSSPLSRCRAFAEELAAGAGLPLRVDERLREVGFGVWEGRTADELNAEWPGCVAAFKHDPVGRRPPGAEPLAEFHARVAAAYEDLVAGHPGQRVLVVAHAGVIRMAIAHALGLAPERAYRIEVGSAAIASIRAESPATGQRFDSLIGLG